LSRPPWWETSMHEKKEFFSNIWFIWFNTNYHKLGPSMYMCFYNILTMYSRLSVHNVLIKSLILCCNDIVALWWLQKHHINDWSTFH
jgi:hypothetical protein